MTEKLRFAEAVCAGHPDRLADTIAERIVALAIARDPDALVGVEVALHRNVVFVDGRVAAGRESAAVAEGEIVAIARQAFTDAGYGTTPSGVFRPDPGDLEVRTDLCLGPLPEDERAIRDVSDDQSICVGHAVLGAPRGPPAAGAGPRVPVRVRAGAAPRRASRPRPRPGRQDARGREGTRPRRRLAVRPSRPGHRLGGSHPRGAGRVRGGGGRVRRRGARADRAGGGLARQRRGGLRGRRSRGRQRARRARSSSPRPTAPPCRSAGERPTARTRARSTRGARPWRVSSRSTGFAGDRRGRRPCGSPTAPATSPRAGSRWSPFPTTSTRKRPSSTTGRAPRTPTGRT